MGVQIVDGPDEARKAVREQIGHGADWIKVYADRSYFVQKDGTLSSIPTFTAEEMKAIVDEAHRLRHKVAAHAMARPGIQNALDAGVDAAVIVDHPAVGVDEGRLEEGGEALVAERGGLAKGGDGAVQRRRWGRLHGSDVDDDAAGDDVGAVHGGEAAAISVAGLDLHTGVVEMAQPALDDHLAVTRPHTDVDAPSDSRLPVALGAKGPLSPR